MLSILIVSTVLGVSSTNWLTIWIILEVNVLAMCAILANNSNINNNGETSTFLYYLIQVILSILIITWVYYGSNNNTTVSILVTIAILSNVGVWPLHGWYINLIAGLEINQSSIIIIITWQNILPIVLVTTLGISNSIVIISIFIIIGTILASLSRLNSNFEINNIIAVSSINNNSWILLSSLVSISCIFTFLALYSTTLVITLSLLENITENSNTIINNFWLNTLIVSNLSGLPPLALFWANILVIKIIINSNLPSEIAFILIISACLLIYHYLWITINETSAAPENSQITINTSNENTINTIVLITSALSALTFLT